MQYIYLIVFLTACFFLVRYWGKKRKKDLKIKDERKQHHLNCLLPFDNMEFENGGYSKRTIK